MEVNGLTVVESSTDNTGAVTWWTVCDGVVTYDALEAAWTAAGLGELPLPARPSPLVALRRAMAVYEQRRVLVRTLVGRSGYAVVEESSDGDTKLAYTQRCAYWINDAGALESEGTTPAEFELVFDALVDNLGRLDARELSSWLVLLARAHRAVALRPSGGVYFVPAAQMPSWSRVVEVFDALVRPRAGVYLLATLRDDRAVAAITAAILAEAETEVASITRSLEEPDLGVRALNTRRARCEALASKVGGYEELLGQRLTAMSTALMELNARIVQAQLVAEGA